LIDQAMSSTVRFLKAALRSVQNAVNPGAVFAFLALMPRENCRQEPNISRVRPHRVLLRAHYPDVLSRRVLFVP